MLTEMPSIISSSIYILIRTRELRVRVQTNSIKDEWDHNNHNNNIILSTMFRTKSLGPIVFNIWLQNMFVSYRKFWRTVKLWTHPAGVCSWIEIKKTLPYVIRETKSIGSWVNWDLTSRQTTYRRRESSGTKWKLLQG